MVIDEFDLNLTPEQLWTSLQEMSEKQRTQMIAAILATMNIVYDLTESLEKQNRRLHVMDHLLGAIVASNCNGRTAIKVTDFQAKHHVNRLLVDEQSMIEVVSLREQ